MINPKQKYKNSNEKATQPKYYETAFTLALSRERMAYHPLGLEQTCFAAEDGALNAIVGSE